VVICESYNVIRSARDATRVAAVERGVETKVIWVNIPEEITRQRWLKNKETKERFDIPQKVYNEAKEEFEPPTQDENIIEYDGSLDLDIWMKRHF